MVSSTLKIAEIDKRADSKYPRSVAFIIGNEFCERFNYYGMRTILVLYLTGKLGYDDNSATVLFHVFTTFVYLFPLIGAIVADSWLGRFKTIFYLSLVYTIGTVVISLGAVPMLKIPVKEMTVLGLLLIAVGTGGIKPCVSAFGGDQFKLPEQAKYLASFFSFFYFAINAGSMLSTAITPILRQDVHCFGQNDCYSLAFGVPAILMILSVIIFIGGKSLYVIKEPSGNMMLNVSDCIVTAVKVRSAEKSTNPREHWLDYAENKCGKQMVGDTKGLLKILVLYLPLPVFWALFDQQGSRWTFQATKMVGDIGIFNIKPDQMQVINPLLILAFIPLFNFLIYPILSKVGIKRPLQKLTIGGLLAAGAFVLSAFVELKLEATNPKPIGINEGQLRIYNGMPCTYTFYTNMSHQSNFSVGPLSIFKEHEFFLTKPSEYDYIAESDNSEKCPPTKGVLKLAPMTAFSYYIKNVDTSVRAIEYIENSEKPKEGNPRIRILANVPDHVGPLLLKGHLEEHIVRSEDTESFQILEGEYTLSYGTNEVTKLNFNRGGAYVIVIQGDEFSGYTYMNHILTKPNSVHILWQMPQYIVITAGEVMFAVTGLEFSFTQAPASMKSVLQAAWLLAVAIGNMLVVVIAELHIFHSQAAEFLLFSALMVFDMFIFILLSMRYTYVNHGEEADDKKDDKLAKIESQDIKNPSGGQINEGFDNEGR